MEKRKLPLGQPTDYPDNYAPELLCAIPRSSAREPLGLTGPLPFHGADCWNAWELTWLGPGGQPQVATARLIVPADSPNIVESKSLKLYLNSFAMSSFASADAVRRIVARDVGDCVGSGLDVSIMPIAATEALPVSRLAGRCLDTLEVDCSAWDVDAELLTADPDRIVSEDVHSHLLRSLCPVTAQPDSGSLQISYHGPCIDPAALLRYIVSYRRHSDFHEACVERMFLDLMARCRPRRLSIQAYYQRRGGIDINPLRSNDPYYQPPALRLWRQ